MASGHRLVSKFTDHFPINEPTKFMNSHYRGLEIIKNQTAKKEASWFLARLIVAESGEAANTLHIIYNPTENGAPITDIAKAKLCAAPEPPFNGEDATDILVYLRDIKELLNNLNINLIDDRTK